MRRLAENPTRPSKASRNLYASSTSSSGDSSSVWSSESSVETDRAKAKKKKQKGKQKVGKKVGGGEGSGRKADRHKAGGSATSADSVVAGDKDEGLKKTAKETK